MPNNAIQFHDLTSIPDLVNSHTILLSALKNLLVEKGIITKDEFIKAMEDVVGKIEEKEKEIEMTPFDPSEYFQR